LTEFDRHAASYEAALDDAIAFARRDHSFYTEAKVRHLLELAREIAAPAELDVLDVGCGVGLTDTLLAPAVRTLHGVDVSEQAIGEAARRNPHVEYRVGDAARLPYPDEAFDLTFAICVLHHVGHAERLALVREMRRVTRVGGRIVVFEHNPLNPLTRVVVARCAFDEDVELLRRGDVVRLLRSADVRVERSRYVLLLPARGALADALERAAAPLPLGAQYYVAGGR
jgi:SAM-dependent methyltransferase